MDDFVIKIAVQQAVAKELKKVESEIKKSKEEFEKTNKKVRDLESNLKKVKTVKAFKEQGDQAKLFGQHLGTAIRKLITYRTIFLALRTIGNIFRDTFNDVVELDAAFADLQKVLRTNQNELGILRSEGFKFARQFGRPIKEVIAGFKTFAQQGLDTNGIIGRTNALMIALAATTLDTSQAIEAITAAAVNFNLEGTQLIRVTDKWLAVERSVPVVANDFASALKGLAQVASELGLTIDDLNGVVAAVGEVTRKSGQAISNSFRTIFARITGEEAIKQFQNIGVSILDLQGNFRPLGTILRDLNAKWGSLSQAQRVNTAQVVGMKRRYTDFLALMNNFNTFVNASKISQEAFNDAALAAQTDINKLQRQLETVNVAWQEFRAAVGEAAVRSIVDASGAIVSLLAAMRDNADVLISTAKFVGILVTSLIALKGILIAGAGIFKIVTAFAALRAALTAATISVGAVGTALGGVVSAALPLIAVIGGVAAVGFLLYNAFSKSSKQSRELGNSLDFVLGKQQALNGAVQEGLKLEQQRIAAALDVSGFKEAQKAYEDIIALRKRVSTSLGTGRGSVLNLKKLRKETGGRIKNAKELKAAEEAARKKLQEISKAALEASKSTSNLKDTGKGTRIEINKMAEGLASLNFRIFNMGITLDNARNKALLFGKDFDSVGFQIKQFNAIVNDFDSRITKLKSRQIEIGFTLSQEEVAGKNLKDEDRRRLLKEQDNITSALVQLEAMRNGFVELNRANNEANLAIKEREFKLQKELNTRIAQQTADLNFAKTALDGIISNQNTSAINLNKQASLQRSRLEIEKQIAREIADKQIKAIEANSSIQDKSRRIIEVRAKLLEKETELMAEQEQIQINTFNALIAQSNEIQSSLKSAISSNLSNLPAFITERKNQEEDLALRRQEIEHEIQQARLDAANAISEEERANAEHSLAVAQRNLALLEQEAQRVGSVLGQVVEGLFAPLAEAAFQKNIDNLVNTLFELQAGEFTIGERIADGISQGTLKSAQQINNKIIKALNEGGDDVAKKIRQAFRDAGVDVANTQIDSGKKMADDVEFAIDNGSSKFGAVLQAGFLAGAQLIGQVLGGGGRGAGIGASIGGLLGTAIGGTIGGAIGAALGGVIGGQFDKETGEFIPPVNDLKNAVDANTIAIENNNKLLELNREFINAPTNFTAPPVQGSLTGGGSININVYANGNASPEQIGAGVADVLEREFGDAIRASRSTSGNFGGGR